MNLDIESVRVRQGTKLYGGHIAEMDMDVKAITFEDGREFLFRTPEETAGFVAGYFRALKDMRFVR